MLSSTVQLRKRENQGQGKLPLEEPERNLVRTFLIHEGKERQNSRSENNKRQDFTTWNCIYYIHRSYRWHHDTHLNISLDSFKFLNGRTMCMHFLFLVSSIAETSYRSWHSVVLSFLDDVYWKSDLLWTIRNFMKTAIWNPTEVGT